MVALATANVMATNHCVVMLLKQTRMKRRPYGERPRSSIRTPAALFVGVAFIVATMFLGVSHAGEWTDYIPPCPDEFVKAWDAWDEKNPAKMPPLLQKPCLVIIWNHAYICGREEGGCVRLGV
jgi:hypothetical protein